MPSTLTRTIGTFERPWLNRHYQRFSGRFQLDKASGLYFDSETPAAHRKLISATFLQLPKTLRDVAIYLGLTVSTTDMPGTLSGSLSAVYGSWDHSDHCRISPHLEMTTISLTPEFVFPHLVHECSHLFWAIQSKAAKARYTRKMMSIVDQPFLEVTDYAQDFYDEWHELLGQEIPFIQQRLSRTLDQWVLESFCESVAKLCCPLYKQKEGRQTDTLLEARQAAIAEHFDLVLENQLELV
jgi:hypothetical protein